MANGDWAVSSLSPRSGPVSTETLVSMSGEFPAPVHVWFDDEPGSIYLQTPTWILVRTPLRAEPGNVDVTLRAGSGIVLTVPEAYTYLEEGDRPPVVVTDPTRPTPSPTSTPATTTTTTGAGNSDNNGGSGDAGGSDGPGPDDEIGGSDPGEGPRIDAPDPDEVDESDDDGRDSDRRRSRNRQARAIPRGEPVDLGNGLVGRRLDGLAEVGGVPACRSDPCRTRRITPSTDDDRADRGGNRNQDRDSDRDTGGRGNGRGNDNGSRGADRNGGRGN